VRRPRDESRPAFTEADRRLIEADFTTLAELCSQQGIDEPEVEAMIAAGRLPQPAYTLPDGRRMVPDDYFRLYDEVGGADDLRAYFIDSFERAAHAAGLDFTDEWNPVSEWTDYIDGTYWVCLRDASPDVIVEKERHIRTISQLVNLPDPESAQWRERLRTSVRALDVIERPFTDFDRARWDYTSRGRYITEIERRYPEAFQSTSPDRSNRSGSP
jgi:hypothetical protein